MSDAMQPAPKSPLAKGSLILGVSGLVVFILSFVLMAIGLSSLNGTLVITGGLMIYLSILLGVVGLILGIVAANQGGSKAGLIINAVLLGIIIILWITGMAGR